MTAKDLKNALLQEAVQGKLVPQIASEGNAKDLLEEIRKERLSHGFANSRWKLDAANNGICDGKNKKTKKGDLRSKSQIRVTKKELSEITEDEIPFEIPENWCWCRGSELFNIRSASRIHQSDWVTHGIPFLRGRELVQLSQNGKLDKPEIFITEDFYNELIKKSGIPQKDDILVSAVGTLGRCYIVKETDRFYYKDAYILCYENFNKLYAPFYKIIIESPYYQAKIREDSQATTVAQFTIIKAKTIPFPLPPLAEQKRIVAAIEKFMPLIEEYGKKESTLKAINEQIGTLTKKAILQEAVQGKLVPQIAAEGNAKDLLEEIRKEKLSHGFANSYGICDGKDKKTKSSNLRSKSQISVTKKELPEITEDEIPFEIPENWCWCRLGEICNLYTGNSINEMEKKLKYTNLKEGRNYISTKDISFDNTINYNNGVKIPFDNENFRLAPEQAILMCIEGGSAGRKIAFTNQIVCFGNKLCCFDSYIKTNNSFIFYFLQSNLFTDLFKDNMNGIIGGVSINTLKTMPIPLPPLAEQKRIVEAIEKMLPLCEKLGE